MSTQQPRAMSGRRRSIWPNFLWSIPLAALLVIGYLGIQALAQRGETVTVTFRRAPDARPGETKVLYQGIEAGQLVKIKPNPDGRRLDFVLRLVPEAKPGLNTNARFWLIGASPSLTDLSSLRAVVSGVAIGYAPGTGGRPTNKFEGVEQAPIILPDAKGAPFRLSARRLGSLGPGSAVLFRGQIVGRVTDVRFQGPQGFELRIFMFQPYDSLVRSGTRFWKISPVRLSFTAGGLAANLAPAESILKGGISLEPAEAANDMPRSAAQSTARDPPNSTFVLYESLEDAREGLSGPSVSYEFAFSGGVAGSLQDNAPVRLLGFQIGEVKSVRLAYDPASGDPLTIATALIYPLKLQLPNALQRPADELRAATDESLRGLVRRGFRAQVSQIPMLVGEESIALVRVKGAAPADLTAAADGAPPRFPSGPGSGGAEDMGAQASQLLSRLNAIPFERIGADVGQITGRLAALASSPKMEDSLAHLNHSLASLDQMLSEAQPQIQPLIRHLNETAAQLSGVANSANQLLEGGAAEGGSGVPAAVRELRETARSIRELTDYLQRHPEALLRGKKAEQ